MTAKVQEMPRRDGPDLSHLAAPDLERIVVYASLTAPGGYRAASRLLDADDFLGTAERRIWTAAAELETPDLHTVCVRLHETGALEGIGGISFLTEMGAGIPHFSDPLHIEPYCRRLKRLSIARRTYTEAEYVRLAAESGDEEIADRLDAASKRIREMAMALETPSAGRGVAEAMERAGGYQSLTTAPSRVVPIEFSWLRRNLPGGGFRPGQLWALAARPGIGKSALALQMAVHAAMHGRRTIIFSLEMSEGELLQRTFALRTMIPLCDIQDGRVIPSDHGRIMAAMNELDQAEMFYICDDVRTLNAIVSRISDCHKRSIPYDLVIVDYLGLVAPPKRSDMRTNEIGQITRALKLAAMDFQCSILALSQMNRAIETDLKREPQLSDLRESGSIEQDSDGVMFLWPDKGDDPIYTLGIKKQRNGPQGRQRLRFLKQYVRFVEEAENGRDYSDDGN